MWRIRRISARCIRHEFSEAPPTPQRIAVVKYLAPVWPGY